MAAATGHSSRTGLKHHADHVVWFDKGSMNDVARVGGKNASLGEMIGSLAASGVKVPGGFATTADAFREFLSHNSLEERIADALKGLDVENVAALAATGAERVRVKPVAASEQRTFSLDNADIEQLARYALLILYFEWLALVQMWLRRLLHPGVGLTRVEQPRQVVEDEGEVVFQASLQHAG